MPVNEFQAAYKSTKHRVASMKSLRLRVFQDTIFYENSNTLQFESKPFFLPNIQTEQIYYQKTTHTWVLKLSIGCVLKIYHLPDRASTRHRAEIRFLRLFSFMARVGASPHSIMPVGHTIFTARDIQPWVNENVPEGQYMVLLAEQADSSLYQELTRGGISPYNLKVLIFQVVFTLMIIQESFPSFRHNDLHLSNVLVQIIDIVQMKTSANVQETTHFVDVYKLSSSQTVCIDLDRSPRRALLWDMHFSSISQRDADRHGTTHAVPAKWNETRHGTSPYYDLHKFFDCLDRALTTLHRPDVRELQALIDIVVPDRVKCLTKKMTRDDKQKLEIWKECITTPSEVLRQPYFSELYKPLAEPMQLVNTYGPAHLA